MNFINAKITPGIVREVVDDYGTIKAEVCGVFSEKDAPDTLPAIYPFFTTIHGTFSRPTVGERIWVISTSDNPEELLYFKQPCLSDEIKNIIDETGTNQVEIISDYKGEKGWAQIFFADGTGWMIRDDNVYINITNEKIVLSTSNDNRTVSITDKGISLGTEGKSKEQGVMGNSLHSLLTQLSSDLSNLSKIAAQNPYTTSLSAPFNLASQNIKKDVDKILSDNVTLD